MSGSLIISRDNEKCGIQLAGRVNFETVVPLRDFVNSLPPEIRDLTVDLGPCVSMDSTCMGVLSMLALKGMKLKLAMRLFNAGSNRQLLKGLGVEKLFHFAEGEFAPYREIIYPEPDQEAARDLETAAETVLDAHQTLIDVDEENQKRFGAVVDMTRQDIERLKQRKK
ncbi:hypothetical protein SDC9_141626 [bioreactor metagenome]|uniref:STAS domain-containing protein n=1 Tax=bioreactor metagenome TaxID=1076179 RepID=A0A645DY82_9ZZZZ